MNKKIQDILIAILFVLGTIIVGYLLYYCYTSLIDFFISNI